MPPTVPDLFRYASYRTFLKDFYEERRRRNRGFSFVAWSRKLKLKSPSTLIMIVNGQRNPSASLCDRIARSIDLGPRESEYFHDLVALEKASRDARLSVILMERLSRSYAGKSFRHLDPLAFAAIARWHYYAIREMVRLPHFDESPEWIAGRLRFRVTPRECSEALRVLLKLGLLERDQMGRLVYASGNIEAGSDTADEGLKRFHESTLENAKTSLRSVEPVDRQISGTTFAVRKQDLPRAKELLRKFQDDFSDRFEAGDGDEIYHLEVAFFPLTRGEQSA